MPKPYILVAAAPISAVTQTSNRQLNRGQQHVDPPRQTAPTAASSTGNPNVQAPIPNVPSSTGQAPEGSPSTSQTTSPSNKGSGTDPKASAGDAGQSQAATSTADLSFSVTTGNYSVKLIYLPDFAHPMAVSESPGLFGKASMQLSLQDGWMLTSVNGSSDSKVSETISAIASLLPSFFGLPGGGGKTGSGAPGGAPGRGTTKPRSPEWLRPGLYSLVVNPSTGLVTGLCSVAYFGMNGPLAGDCAGALNGILLQNTLGAQ